MLAKNWTGCCRGYQDEWEGTLEISQEWVNLGQADEDWCWGVWGGNWPKVRQRDLLTWFGKGYGEKGACRMPELWSLLGGRDYWAGEGHQELGFRYVDFKTPVHIQLKMLRRQYVRKMSLSHMVHSSRDFGSRLLNNKKCVEHATSINFHWYVLMYML